MSSANGKGRSGYLVSATHPLSATFIVQEQPMILRAAKLTAPVQLEQRVEPSTVSLSVYTWAPFIVNGVQQELSPTNTILTVSLPGTYRITNIPTGVGPVVTFEEDGRTVEWDSITAVTGSSGGGVGPQGPPGQDGAEGTPGIQGPPGPVDPNSHSHVEQLPIPITSPGQTLFTVVSAPFPYNPALLQLFVNGVRYHFGADFGITGAGLVLWTGPFALDVTDELVAAFVVA